MNAKKKWNENLSTKVYESWLRKKYNKIRLEGSKPT